MRNATRLAILSFLLLFAVRSAGIVWSDEPALPAGLEDAAPANNSDPALPAGLEEDAGTSNEPSLPAGLGSDEPSLPASLEAPADETTTTKEPPKKSLAEVWKDLGFSGFWEARGGVRTQHDPYEKQASIGETRLNTTWQKETETLRMKFSGDLLYDQVDNQMGDVDLRRGTGFFDFREGWVGFSPMTWMDVKAGRQILTWGTGDLLFVNDTFPKDWQAFFIGRDVDYLKAPSDAVKVSAFSDIVNVDFVFTPLMNPSRFVTGERLSYFNRNLDHIAGQNAVIHDDLPSQWFRDAEYATRLSNKLGSYEFAAYGSWGFYKTPEGYDPITNKAYFPRLNTYGGSVRGPLWRGIANAEAAYYDSQDDRKGDNPLIPNSQVRLLAGYEMDLPEIAKELTVGVQYYVELMMDYDAYRRTLPANQPVTDEARQLVTLRVTKQFLNQTLTVGMFTYYSPTDSDAYLRPNIKYKIDDHWTAELGGNVFFGIHPYTFFGQFEQDSNVYVSLRYAY